MSPSSLRTWMAEHGEPVTIREIDRERQARTGTFAEKRIQRSMKSLEMAGLVAFTMGEHGAKLWYLVPDQEQIQEPSESTA